MKFKSKYLKLTTYLDGSQIQFMNGEYETTDKKEIALLKTIKDVEIVEEVDKVKQK